MEELEKLLARLSFQRAQKRCGGRRLIRLACKAPVKMPVKPPEPFNRSSCTTAPQTMGLICTCQLPAIVHANCWPLTALWAPAHRSPLAAQLLSLQPHAACPLFLRTTPKADRGVHTAQMLSGKGILIFSQRKIFLFPIFRI